MMSALGKTPTDAKPIRWRATLYPTVFYLLTLVLSFLNVAVLILCAVNTYNMDPLLRNLHYRDLCYSILNDAALVHNGAFLLCCAPLAFQAARGRAWANRFFGTMLLLGVAVTLAHVLYALAVVPCTYDRLPEILLGHPYMGLIGVFIFGIGALWCFRQKPKSG